MSQESIQPDIDFFLLDTEKKYRASVSDRLLYSAMVFVYLPPLAMLLLTAIVCGFLWPNASAEVQVLLLGIAFASGFSLSRYLVAKKQLFVRLRPSLSLADECIIKAQADR